MIYNIFFLCWGKRLRKNIKTSLSLKKLYDYVFKILHDRQVRKATFAHREKFSPNFQVRGL